MFTEKTTFAVKCNKGQSVKLVWGAIYYGMFSKRETMKKIIALSLVAGGLAFAQSGLMGGTSGIHQHNAYTLGQWGFEVGTGGDVSFDSWSHSRGGVLTVNKQNRSFHDMDGTFSGNVHAAIGLMDFLDLGIALPLYYDHANMRGKGESDLWKPSRGDLDLWLKANVLGDESSFFAMAAMVDVYIPTGETGAGVRPRHAWYLDEDASITHPYTSDEFNFGGTLVFTMNFGALGVPVVWNTHVGFVYAGDGQSTLVYGTGVNYIATDWLEAFLEFSGEMRVESGAYRRDPLDDPMLLTPGVRFHLPWNIDFAMGVDIAIRTLGNLGYDYDDEMDCNACHTVHYTTESGAQASYGYAPTPTFAGTAALIWRFGKNGKKDEDGDGVEDNKDQCPHTPDVATVDSVGCPIDSDKDGMIDGLDKCPNTPEGAEIDTTGCPMDGDKDGVFDGLDKCENTPAGAKVDSTGCPLDADKDGVPDGLDKCENTPAGAKVDSTGCPLDTDKDGVGDYADKCENTPAGAKVDSVGCPLDADKDGVPDGLDKCPNSTPGAQVNTEGCEGDFDNDGVPDALDQCPNTPAGLPVDSTGCPADADKDGVPDGLDKCPNTPANLSVDNTGCPLDFDKDGVPDGLDKCPNTPAGVPVDSTGCSADADKDGVPDALDKCPNTPAGAPVDSLGCPMDSDKDGVPDYQDKCPNTLEGVEIDKKGCPKNKKEDLEQLKKGIQFQTGSAKLTKASYKTLDDIIKLMQKIKSAHLEVQGHTDNTGSAETNKKLSQERAQAVVDYFLQKGIESDRVRAVGYGPDKPIASNKNKKGRAKNRRVELVPFQK